VGDRLQQTGGNCENRLCQEIRLRRYMGPDILAKVSGTATSHTKEMHAIEPISA
jgi:hypothetical protein